MNIKLRWYICNLLEDTIFDKLEIQELHRIEKL